MPNGKGPFGGYRTRREQLDAQEKAAGALMPEEPEPMDPVAPARNGNGMNGNGSRRRRDNYPWE